MQLSKFISNFRKNFVSTDRFFKPNMKVVEIWQNEEKDYFVTVQIINKNVFVKMKPETILSNDNATNQFSPIDVRTLTYLGYLGINTPQYKILAEKLSDEDKMFFALHKKGEKTTQVKAAKEILKDNELLKDMDSQDIAKISYFAAIDNINNEQRDKEAAKSNYKLKLINNDNNINDVEIEK